MTTDKELAMEATLCMIHQFGYKWVYNYYKKYSYLLNANFIQTKTGFIVQQRDNKKNKITVNYYEPEENYNICSAGKRENPK